MALANLNSQTKYIAIINNKDPIATAAFHFKANIVITKKKIQKNPEKIYEMNIAP